MRKEADREAANERIKKSFEEADIYPSPLQAATERARQAASAIPGRVTAAAQSIPSKAAKELRRMVKPPAQRRQPKEKRSRRSVRGLGLRRAVALPGPAPAPRKRGELVHLPLSRFPGAPSQALHVEMPQLPQTAGLFSYRLAKPKLALGQGQRQTQRVGIGPVGPTTLFYRAGPAGIWGVNANISQAFKVAPRSMGLPSQRRNAPSPSRLTRRRRNSRKLTRRGVFW